MQQVWLNPLRADAVYGLAMGAKRRTAAKSKPSRASSSGSGHSPTTGSSSEFSPRNALVGHYSLDDLPVLWDNNPIIRDRLRHQDPDSKTVLPLVVGLDAAGAEAAVYVEATLEVLKANEYVMMPVFHHMSKNMLMLPHIDRMIQAVDSFYKISKQPRGGDHCYQQAWAIRRLIGYTKHQCYREFPPQD